MAEECAFEADAVAGAEDSCGHIEAEGRVVSIRMLSSTIEVDLQMFATVGDLMRHLQESESLRNLQLFLEGEGEALRSCRSLAELPSNASLLCIVRPNPIVIDIGSDTIRAGFSGYDSPSAVFPPIVAVPRTSQGQDEFESTDAEVFVGKAAEAKRGELMLKRPVRNGVVTDWSHMEAIWRHIFFEELKVDPSDQSVLVTEPPLNPGINRSTLVIALFEDLGVGRVHVAVGALLCLFAASRTTGVVLDIGTEARHAVPVYEGIPLCHAIIRHEKNNSFELDDCLLHACSSMGCSLPNHCKREILQDMKETLCHVAKTYHDVVDRSAEQRAITYRLPDGQIVTLDACELANIPERLFQPYKFYGGDFHRSGLHEDVWASVTKADVDIRLPLLSSIVLAGGTSRFRGLEERFLQELEQLVPTSMIGKLNVVACGVPHMAWVGGSILASLPAFDEARWISKEAFNDVGPSICHQPYESYDF